MKLANALNERSVLQSKLPQLQKRLLNNAKVQEGDSPAEDPQDLLEELHSTLSRLEELIERINLTNSRTISGGKTLTELLARRECLQKRITILQSFLQAASEKVDRYSRAEIVVKSTVNVASLQKELDSDSAELRLLDEQLQELNWTTELCEE